MKQIILLLSLTVFSLTCIGQTVPNPPTGSVLATSYIAPNGMVYTGSIPKQFTNMATVQKSIQDNKTNTPEAKRISLSDSIKTTGTITAGGFVRSAKAVFGNTKAALANANTYVANTFLNSTSGFPNIGSLFVNGFNTTVPSSYISSGMYSQIIVDSTNTQNWPTSAFSHPIIRAFEGLVRSFPGATGNIPKGSVFYATAAGAGAVGSGRSGPIYDEFNIFDITYDHTFNGNYWSGMRISDVDGGILGNTFLYMVNGDSQHLPPGNFGIYEDLSVNNYFGAGNSLFGSKVDNGANVQIFHTPADALPGLTLDGNQVVGGRHITFRQFGIDWGYIDNNAALFGAGIRHKDGAMNAAVNTTLSGTVITRNIADSGASLIVRQLNAGSTGDLLNLQFGGLSSKFKIDYRGIVGINGTLLTAGQSFRVNAAGTASEAFTPATTTDISNLSTVYAPISGSVNYIQKSPSTAQAASINITGTINSSSIFSTGSVSGSSLSSSAGIQAGTDITAIGSVIGSAGSFSGKVTSSAAPTNPSDLTNKSFVDAGLALKPNLATSNTYTSGTNTFPNAGIVVGSNTGIGYSIIDNASFGVQDVTNNRGAGIAQTGFTIRNSTGTLNIGLGSLTTARNVTFGDGSGNVVLSSDGSATLDFPSTAASASSDLTLTITGANLGDNVVCSPPVGSVMPNSIYSCWVSATNTVTIRFSNLNPLAASDPPSGVFKPKVIR